MVRKRTRYKVGYGKPPKHSQFKPGQSGNPKGRPVQSKNTYDIMKKELESKVSLKEGDKQIILTKKQALLRHMINKAVQGDFKAMNFVFNQILVLEGKEEELLEMQRNISEEDKEILLSFLEENSNNTKMEKIKNEKNKKKHNLR